jgi:hypothetical protein
MEIERGMREVWCSAFGWRRFRARIPAAWTLGIALRCKVENSTVSVRATSQNTNMSAYSYTAATCQNCCGNIVKRLLWTRESQIRRQRRGLLGTRGELATRMNPRARSCSRRIFSSRRKSTMVGSSSRSFPRSSSAATGYLPRLTSGWRGDM